MENIFISRDIFSVQNEQVWVNSVDVAEYYGMEHHNLLKAIDNKLITLPELVDVNINVYSYKASNGKSNKCYLLDKRGFIAISMGLTGERAARVQLAFTDAFIEMEAELSKPKQQTPPTPQLPSKEEAILRVAMMFGEIAETPKHILLTGVVKEIKRQTGTDMSFALEGAKALESVKKEEMMLEPTELGRMFKQELGELGFAHGNTGINANRFLASKGAQHKNNGFWSANEGFEQYTFRNPWNSKTKEGYNLKWNIDFFRSLINN